MNSLPQKIELLSPARNADIGIEAINCGADAVYIGAKAFGARHAAGNSLEDIARLVNHAHRYGAKVYVTLNTILYDSELEEARKLALELHSIGVDALITQDVALLKMDLPIALHASTQMDNRSVERAKQLQAWGFRQIVLARELGLDEIRQIHEACPMLKLEAFVHGALCVSYSGQCYASQYCFNRSANRGECAQFCRLAFDLETSDGRKIVRNKHLLSLKDMNRSAQLEEMIDAGVCSFKIEGRLKDVAYVKNTTAYYSHLLDEIIKRRPHDYCRSSYGRSHVGFEPDLKKSFNRGFTDYFLRGRTEDVASINTPKALGEPVGHVKETRNGYILIGGVSTFHNGDGLCFFDHEGTLQGFRVNKVENNRLYPYPFPKGIAPGVQVYRNNDAQFENQLSKPTPRRTIPVTITLESYGDGFRLMANDDFGHKALHEVATQKDLARTPQNDRIRKELQKLGDTFFEAREIVLNLDKDYFIPASNLSEWRRSLTDKLANDVVTSSIEEELSDIETDKQHGFVAETLYYTANVSNKFATQYLESKGAREINPAFELQEPEGKAVVMNCKHCIRYSLGMCVKHSKQTYSGKRNIVSSVNMRDFGAKPLVLSLPDGRRFPLVFDCNKCEMQVLKEK